MKEVEYLFQICHVFFLIIFPQNRVEASTIDLASIMKNDKGNILRKYQGKKMKRDKKKMIENFKNRFKYDKLFLYSSLNSFHFFFSSI